ncbi:hypothetical protein [Halostella sp. PRR32]|uniref:DUF7331 family protein n=1 Tax=Halostella sp. PRR32 TaxID=3098147 RepID=UPI002B1D3A27|nr:hypothetical protein [Halostella sp. PRR32]
MRDTIAQTSDRGSMERPDLEQYVSYSDGDDTVICDRENPSAWIKSDVLDVVEP